MLNNEGQRELAYVVTIDAIEPIEGSDNCEAAVVGGWRIMTRKGTFKPGNIAIYFEIDSKVPETPEFEFLVKKHYKVKTQKYTFGGKGNFLSQGLLMSFEDFPELFEYDIVSGMGWTYTYKAKPKIKESTDALVNVHDGLTELLGVTYSVADDNKRKAKVDKYSKMRARHQKLFRKSRIARWLYDKTWGKKLLFLFLGNKKDKRGWPDWVRKTDEERCQNLPQLFPGDNTEWIVTEKIDGTSTTFTYKQKGKNKGFYVCSRNVCFDMPDTEKKKFWDNRDIKEPKKCYYDTNVYLEMAEKYNMEEVLKKLMTIYPNKTFVTLQGETYGDGIQKRDYGLKDGHHDFRAFNLIYGDDINNQERVNTVEMEILLDELDTNIHTVPILDTKFKIPTTCDELLEIAEGKSELDGEMREGIVLRTHDGVNSFKAVSNNFLIKYHNAD